MRDHVTRRRAGRPLRAWLAAALLALAACQPLPHPFADDRPPPDSPLLRPKDGAGVVVPPVRGVAEPVASGLAEAMAAALRDSDVPASTRARNRESYVLHGTAQEHALAGGRASIEVDWDLRAADGSVVGKHAETLEASIPAWRAGNAPLLADLAKSAAPQIADFLQEKGAIDLGTSEPHVLVRQVSGAPGDGPHTLARAMVASLEQANVAVTDREPPAGAAGKLYVLAGTVVTAPAGEGKQQIKVTWSLFDPAGHRIGQVNQENAIPAGSLDQHWGDVAYAVANAAAGGIVAILDHLKNLPAGS